MTDPFSAAFEAARDAAQADEVPVGAAIARAGEIIAVAGNRTLRDRDPTAHAEINVIRLAAHKLQSTKLKECYLYTTYEPCPMCTTAAIWARMAGIVYGASREDRTPECPWRIVIPASDIIAAGDPKLELFPEFMRQECRPLLSLSHKR